MSREKIEDQPVETYWSKDNPESWELKFGGEKHSGTGKTSLLEHLKDTNKRRKWVEENLPRALKFQKGIFNLVRELEKEGWNG